MVTWGDYSTRPRRTRTTPAGWFLLTYLLLVLAGAALVWWRSAR